MNEAYQNYSKHLSKNIAYDLMKNLTQYHRIQGSRGIWRAVEVLKSRVEELGFDTRVFRIRPGEELGYFKAPVSWDPIDAWIEFKIGGKVLARYNLVDHPTLISAHSPGNEGCSELSFCRGDECRGEAVLVTGYPLIDLYYNVDSRIIVYYSDNRYHDAVPYTGLFIDPSDKILDKTVINIPYKLASRLVELITVRGRKISVCWKTSVEYHREGLPVLMACRGGDPGVVFISHICHPKPGAHDNASGSTANYLAAYVLSRVGEKFRYSSCHVWVPEYTGTVALKDRLPWRPMGVVNLDMVGSKQSITGSTLTLVNPPRFLDSLVAPTLWLSIQKVFDQSRSFNNVSQPSIRYGLTPYTAGSDHDVFVGWGVDSSMLNEWPSRYYHTDMDKLETISPLNIGLTSLASVLAGYVLTRSRDKSVEYKKLYESIVRNWYRVQAYKTGYSLSYIAKYLLKKPLIMEAPEKPLIVSPITSRKIYRVLGRERFREIREINGVYTYLGVYAPVAEKIGLRHHVKHYKAELLIAWSRRQERMVSETWSIIKSEIKL